MNENNGKLSDRIGPSTIEMYDPEHELSLERAIGSTLDAGFRCIELHMDTWQGYIGNPGILVHPGVSCGEMSGSQIDRLIKQLEPFEHVTVHGTPIDINIAADNPGIREESVRQYLDAIEFTHKIGSKVCTFHPGKSRNALLPPEVTIQRHVEFGKRASELLEKYNIFSGFENTPAFSDPHWYKNIIDQVNSDKFGMMLDFGHAVMGHGKNTETLLEYLELLGNDIVQVHVHQVLHWIAQGLPIDHQPLDKGWGYDIQTIFKATGKLENQDFPIVLEIMGPSMNQMLDNCQYAKKQILKYWF